MTSLSSNNEPTGMHVAFAFFRGDALLHRGELLLRDAPGFVVYGEHHHVQLEAGAPFAERPEFQLFAGLVIEHTFELPACPITLRYYTVAGAEQTKQFEAALRMGVHESDDWESVELGDYTFAFRCMPLP